MLKNIIKGVQQHLIPFFGTTIKVKWCSLLNWQSVSRKKSFEREYNCSHTSFWEEEEYCLDVITSSRIFHRIGYHIWWAYISECFGNYSTVKLKHSCILNCFPRFVLKREKKRNYVSGVKKNKGFQICILHYSNFVLWHWQQYLQTAENWFL